MKKFLVIYSLISKGEEKQLFIEGIDAQHALDRANYRIDHDNGLIRRAQRDQVTILYFTEILN